MSILAGILFCITLVGADQVIKFFVLEYLKPVGYVDVIDNILRFRYVENTGAIFGSFSAYTAVLTVVSIVLLVVVIYFLITNKSKSKIINICLLLMVSGGIGNIIDRIRLKYVVDFIEVLFVDFAVFNFADCLITVGAFVLIFYLIYDMIKDSKNNDKVLSTEENNDAE